MKLKLGGGVESQWSKALQSLVLPEQPRTPELLLREYTRQVRGKRLVLTSDPTVVSPNGPSGMWVTSGDVDLVWIHPGATGVLRGRIIGHELGHMVNGDEPAPLSLNDVTRLLRGLCGYVSLSLWESSLCRETFDDPGEQKAEKFSYFADKWIKRSRPAGASLVDNVRESLDVRNEFR